jgi:ABC-type uncharacterized transport system ATPase subunit
VFDKLSCHINEGEIFALLDLYGAGKFTTVRMILQIIHPDVGLIQFGSTIKNRTFVDRSMAGYLPDYRINNNFKIPQEQ